MISTTRDLVGTAAFLVLFLGTYWGADYWVKSSHMFMGSTIRVVLLLVWLFFAWPVHTVVVKAVGDKVWELALRWDARK